jgi:hypothetical protein
MKGLRTMDLRLSMSPQDKNQECSEDFAAGAD